MFMWVALKGKCKTSKDNVDNYRVVFESRMSAGGVEKLLCSENPKKTFHLGPLMALFFRCIVCGGRKSEWGVVVGIL